MATHTVGGVVVGGREHASTDLPALVELEAGQVGGNMSAHLVTIVRDLSIDTQTFSPNARDVLDRCVATSTHRVSQFDFFFPAMQEHRSPCRTATTGTSPTPQYFRLAESVGPSRKSQTGPSPKKQRCKTAAIQREMPRKAIQ